MVTASLFLPLIGLSMGAALLAMSIAQIVAGVAVDPVAIVIFTTLAAVDAVRAILLLRSISDVPMSGQLIPDAYVLAPSYVRSIAT